MHIHERIKIEREKAGLKPGQLAKKLEIPRTTYLYWESKTPDIEKIKAVAKALGLPDNYFFDKKDKKTDEIIDTPNMTTEKNINSKYIALLEKSLDEKEQDLKTYRSTLQKITSVEKELNTLTITVDAHEGKWRDYEPIILGLREFVTAELSTLKKKSREEVAASLSIKVEEQRKVVQQSYIQKD